MQHHHKPCRCIFTAITDVDRHLEQQLKERLDAITYPSGFFRDCDEPNESFAARAIREQPTLRRLISVLPIWPNVSCPCNVKGAPA